MTRLLNGLKKSVRCRANAAVTQSAQFLSDLRRQRRRGKNLEDLIAIVELLVEDGDLPTEYRPHQLTGEWKGVMECHIDPDWLLIYEVAVNAAFLIRTGTTPICSNNCAT